MAAVWCLWRWPRELIEGPFLHLVHQEHIQTKTVLLKAQKRNVTYHHGMSGLQAVVRVLAVCTH